MCVWGTTYLLGRGVLQLLLDKAAAKLVPAEVKDVAADVLHIKQSSVHHMQCFEEHYQYSKPPLAEVPAMAPEQNPA